MAEFKKRWEGGRTSDRWRNNLNILLVLLAMVSQGLWFTNETHAQSGPPASDPIITTLPNELPPTVKGEFSQYYLKHSGDKRSDITWKIVNPPGWITLNAREGLLSGTPPTTMTEETQEINIELIKGDKTIDQRKFSLKVFKDKEEKKKELDKSCFLSPHYDKVAPGDLFSWLSVGPTVTTQLFRYNFATEKASFNTPGLGVGAAFRIYLPGDMEAHPLTLQKSIKNIKPSCRATTIDVFSDTSKEYFAKSFLSLSPVLFASLDETEKGEGQKFNLQPAIVAGFFQDLINVGVGFNLSGQNQGQVFLLMGLGIGFSF